MIVQVAGWLTHRIAPYVVLALGAAVVALWGWGVVQGWRVDAAKGEAATANAALETAAAANTSNIDTIARLQVNLDLCVANQKMLSEAAAEMEAARQRYMKGMQQDIIRFREERNAILDTTAACGILRTTPVCGALDERLRALAGQD